jgi:hypothetical protein
MSGRNLGDAKRDPAEQKAGDQSKGDDRHGLRPQIGLVAGSSANMRAIQDIGRVRNLARPRDGRKPLEYGGTRKSFRPGAMPTVIVVK